MTLALSVATALLMVSSIVPDTAGAATTLAIFEQPAPIEYGASQQARYRCTAGCGDIREIEFFNVRGSEVEQVGLRGGIGTDDQIFDWTPFPIRGDDLRLRIVAKGHQNQVIATVDSEPFDVYPPTWSQISILYPNGGEVLTPGTTATITWASTDLSHPAVETVHLEYTLDGSDWSEIPVAIDAAESSALWDVPFSPTATATAKIRITERYMDFNGNPRVAYTDESDAGFTIDPVPVMIPTDFPTIQQGIDAAGSGPYNMQVEVQPKSDGSDYTATTTRTYTGGQVIEAVAHMKPGIVLRGIGEITLSGSGNTRGVAYVNTTSSEGVEVHNLNLVGFDIGLSLARHQVPQPNASLVQSCSVSGSDIGIAIGYCTAHVFDSSIDNGNTGIDTRGPMQVERTAITDMTNYAIISRSTLPTYIANCTIEDTQGGVYSTYPGGALTLSECDFNNVAGQPAVKSTQGLMGVYDCTFMDSYSAISSVDGVINVSRCAIVGGDYGITIGDASETTAQTIEKTTIRGLTGRGLTIVRDGNLLVREMVISECDQGVWPISADNTTFECNNVWGNTTDFASDDPTGTAGNISLDPEFCSFTGYGVSASSPNLPANNSCGVLLGAGTELCPTGFLVPDVAASTVETINGALALTPDPDLPMAGEQYEEAFHTDIVVNNSAGEALEGVVVTWTYSPELYECAGRVDSGTTDALGELTLDNEGGGNGTSDITAQLGSGPVVSLLSAVPTRSPDYDGDSGDGYVSFGDLVAFSAEYGGNGGLTHDYTNDGAVDFSDLLFMSPAYNGAASCSESLLREASASSSDDPWNAFLAAARMETEALLDVATREAMLAFLDQLDGKPTDGTGAEEIPSPSDYALLQNRPNPFNPSTEILFSLPNSARVALSIFDLGGRRILTLVEDREFAAGRHAVTWSGRDETGAQVASGVYFYRLVTEEFTQTRKMVLVK